MHIVIKERNLLKSSCLSSFRLSSCSSFSLCLGNSFSLCFSNGASFALLSIESSFDGCCLCFSFCSCLLSW